MTTLTIRKETSRSDSLLLTADLIGITCPDAWTTAPLTFRVSTNGTDYVDATDANGELVVMQVIPGVFLPVPPGACAGGSYIVLVSGMPDDPVPQQMDRDFAMNLVGATHRVTEKEKEAEKAKEAEKTKEQKDARGPDRHK